MMWVKVNDAGYYHQSTSRRAVHEATTRDLHPALSAAALGAVSRDSLLLFISLSTVLRHVSLGRPRFLLPCGVHLSAILGSEEVGMRQTCPSHLQRRIWIVSCIVATLALTRRFLLEIISGQKILRIRRRHLFWKTSSFLSSAAVVFNTQSQIGGR